MGTGSSPCKVARLALNPCFPFLILSGRLGLRPQPDSLVRSLAMLFYICQLHTESMRICICGSLLCKHMNIWYVYKVRMSPAPSGSLALQHVKLGDALEIRDAIIFDFCPGLPHIRCRSINPCSFSREAWHCLWKQGKHLRRLHCGTPVISQHSCLVMSFTRLAWCS